MIKMFTGAQPKTCYRTKNSFITNNQIRYNFKMDKIFSVIGDSNVKRHLNPTNCRDRPRMSSAQLIPCGKLEILSECLRNVRDESNVCILSCVTNVLTSSSGGSSTLSLRIEPVLRDFFEA